MKSSELIFTLTWTVLVKTPQQRNSNAYIRHVSDLPENGFRAAKLAEIRFDLER